MNDGYTCRDCGAYFESYAHLKHYDWYSGGYCHNCHSEFLVADSEREEEDA